MNEHRPSKDSGGSAVGNDETGEMPVKTVSDSRVKMIQVAQHTACDVHDYLLLGTILKWMDICAVSNQRQRQTNASAMPLMTLRHHSAWRPRGTAARRV